MDGALMIGSLDHSCARGAQHAAQRARRQTALRRRRAPCQGECGLAKLPGNATHTMSRQAYAKSVPHNRRPASHDLHGRWVQ